MSIKNNSGITPTGGHILVLPDKVEQTTKGGIIIPETARDKEQAAATTGVVIAIGNTAWIDIDDSIPWASVGDRVSYGRYAGTVMKGKDEVDYTLLNDIDLLAKLNF